MDLKTYKNSILSAVELHFKWRSNWNKFAKNSSTKLSFKKANKILFDLQKRLNNSYPFFHPSYLGQMISPPHEVAMLSYFLAMQINPNNHALDGGPATTELEVEVIKQIAKMFGYTKWLGHLTSSGTIANLEALWVAREIHPNKIIVFSSESHYTHKRMCKVLKIPFIEVPTDVLGKINISHLKKIVKNNNVGTIVANIGTTGFGAVDNLKEILPLAKKYKVRIHADAAYGGFFTLLAKKNPAEVENENFGLLKYCDSIVIDPHKRGLQPYGCGCVIFKDPAVGKFYKHDSPYTYFTSNKLHLGEVTLECSRAGASAAALWATLKAFPLKLNSGLGNILSETRKCALKWHSLISKSNILISLLKPELDIVVYFPKTNNFSTKSISLASEKIFNELMNRKQNPIYLAKYKYNSKMFKQIFPNAKIDSKEIILLRSVFMKPEHDNYITKTFKDISNSAAKYI